MERNVLGVFFKRTIESEVAEAAIWGKQNLVVMHRHHKLIMHLSGAIKQKC